MAYRFDVFTKSNPVGDDVGADAVEITVSGALMFTIDGRATLAYSAHEWIRVEFSGEE